MQLEFHFPTKIIWICKNANVTACLWFCINASLPLEFRVGENILELYSTFFNVLIG